jgi:hypothetical protein
MALETGRNEGTHIFERLSWWLLDFGSRCTVEVGCRCKVDLTPRFGFDNAGLAFIGGEGKHQSIVAQENDGIDRS